MGDAASLGELESRWNVGAKYGSLWGGWSSKSSRGLFFFFFLIGKKDFIKMK